jgi:hypothetical protein
MYMMREVFCSVFDGDLIFDGWHIPKRRDLTPKGFCYYYLAIDKLISP